MTPVMIPAGAGACFAMYQSAPGPAVLMCPPFGDEALKTARVWRNLALDLEVHGVGSLRFDLPGTGNSADEPTEAGQVEGWRDAIRACAAWLGRRHDGRVILFGHRFGALLALDAVASGVAAERLVLLDPPASGTALARHLRGRARMEGLGSPPEGEDYIQVGGAPLSAATLQALSSLPAPLAGDGLPPALLVLNDSEASPNPWRQRLRAGGSGVDSIRFDGFDAFVPQDAFRAKPPAAVLAGVRDYLLRSVGPLARGRATALPSSALLELDDCSETPLQFGPASGMFGILCRPHQPAPGAPALLLPTTGADPCSGMSRIWTDLARRVARNGTTSLRFDMSGIGESQGRPSGNLLAAAYHPDRMADLGRAVDALAALGFDRVTITAYCSGAYAAWHAALSDERISGLLAANLVHLNLQTMLADDALHSRPGESQLGRKHRSWSKLVPSAGMTLLRGLDDHARHAVPRPVRHILRRWEADGREVRRHVKALRARGCSVTIVMAQDDHGHLRLRRAFGETPRLPDGVDLVVIPDADHQFSDRRHRARFLDLAAAFALQLRPTPFASATPAPVRLSETAA